MRAILLVTLLASMHAIGCDDDAQQGRFAVSGSSSSSLSGVTGQFTIVQGKPLPLTSQNMAPQPLLYILVLNPGSDSLEGGFSHNDGIKISNLKWWWKTAQSDATLTLSWDRGTDDVFAEGSSFSRDQGNVFILVKDMSGNVSVKQYGPLDAGLDRSAALKQIRSILPPDSPASAVTLK